MKKRREDLLQQAKRIVLGVGRAALPREDAAADDVLAGSGFWPEWSLGFYPLHGVCRYEGQVWRCVQAHEAQVGWAPGPGSSLWAAYHARELELARPWVRPYGSHDAYQPGEYMIWSDGRVYCCIKADIVWGPDVLGDAWAVVGDEEQDEDQGMEPWVQPSGGHDAYGLGDQVRHEGLEWESLVAGNVWEPGAYGWRLI